MMHRLIYKLGVAKRNPSLFPYFSFLQESDKWSREKLVQHQLKQLQKLIKFAYENSPYYTNVFNQIGLRPEDINSIKDLKRIPLVDKSVLINHLSLIHI